MNERSYETIETTGECQVRIIDAAAVARVSGRLPSAKAQGRLAGVFAACGDQTRARLLLALAAEDLCVCDLAEIAGVSESAVSHQLRLLRDLDLVAWERDGKRAVYRLADDHVRQLLAIGLAHAEEGEGA
jgi:ArsR family transcriptional regulator